MGVVSSPPEQQGLQEDRILSDVDLESRGGPTASGLYQVWWNTVLGQGSGTSRAHGLPCDVGVEKQFQALGEERPGGAGTVSAKPEVR